MLEVSIEFLKSIEVNLVVSALTKEEEFELGLNKEKEVCEKYQIDFLQFSIEDPENIEYDKGHTTIYSGVGLGEDWRVDESIDYEEITTASNGFKKVTAKFHS
jgi:hypothetical protein